MERDDERISKERIDFLENLLVDLRRRRKRVSAFFWAFLIIGANFLIFTPISYFVSDNTHFLFGLIYGVIFLIIPFFLPRRAFEVRILDVENELYLLRTARMSIDQRAERIFKLHQFELRKYYDQNLKQSGWIFAVGLGCIIFGFAIIGVTVYLVHKATLSPPAHSGFAKEIILASFGAVGGILSNFIAVVYLRMHSRTMEALTKFHRRLVDTHHLHFGNFLNAKISDPTLREETLARMASNLSGLIGNGAE